MAGSLAVAAEMDMDIKLLVMKIVCGVQVGVGDLVGRTDGASGDLKVVHLDASGGHIGGERDLV
jgi:hypothetical protein